MTTIVVGIDPGTTTGYAEWCRKERRLLAVEGLLIHRAFERVLRLHSMGQLHSVTFEDARLRTWYGNAGREQLQGAGSIKRDCTAWADFLGDYEIPYRSVKPQKGLTKWTTEAFRARTKWEPRTNEHGRDAAFLVWGHGG